MCQWTCKSSINKVAAQLRRLGFILMISAFLRIPAFAQVDNSQEPLATEEVALQPSEALISDVTTTLSTHVHGLLTNKVDDYLSRRLERSNFRFDISLKFSNEVLNKLLSGLGAIEEDIFLKSLSESDYVVARRYLQEAKIVVTIADFIPAAEAREIVNGLGTAIRGGMPLGPEKFELKTAKFAPSALERSVLLQANEARRNMLEEHKLKSETEKSLEKMRQDFLAKQKNAREQELETQLKKTTQVKDELAAEFDAEAIRQKIRRELSGLFRFAALGGSFGIIALLAFVILVVGILLAVTKLGRFFVEGSTEVASALKERSGASSSQPVVIQQSPQGANQNSLDLSDQFQFQQEVVVALREISQEIKNSVETDMNTASALVSKLVGGKDIQSVFALFEIIGATVAQKLFSALPVPDQKTLRQYFYSGVHKSLNLAQIYNVALGFRSGLNSTSIVVSDKAEKAFAHLLLSHSNEELASALTELPVDRSLKIIAAIPPERAAQILRVTSRKQVQEWVTGIGVACQNRESINFEDVSFVKNAIIKPDRVRFDESKSYLKSLMNELDEDMAEVLLKGLQKFPDLLSAVSGNRATLDDLWSQPADIIFKLLNQLELRRIAILMWQAPDEVQNRVLEQFQGRRKERFEEEFNRLKLMNDEERQKLISDASEVKKKILETLANWSESGKVPTLPSRMALSRPSDATQVA